MALVFQQAREDLLESPDAVGEPHLTLGRHGVQPIVVELSQGRKSVSRCLEASEQRVGVDCPGAVGRVVIGGMRRPGGPSGGDELGDPLKVLGRVRGTAAIVPSPSFSRPGHVARSREGSAAERCAASSAI